jgi:hypothetical protein
MARPSVLESRLLLLRWCRVAVVHRARRFY